MDIDVESFFVASLLDRLPRRRNGFVQPHNMHTAATFSIWQDVNIILEHFVKQEVCQDNKKVKSKNSTIVILPVLPSINQVNQHQKKIQTIQQITIFLLRPTTTTTIDSKTQHSKPPTWIILEYREDISKTY